MSALQFIIAKPELLRVRLMWHAPPWGAEQQDSGTTITTCWIFSGMIFIRSILEYMSDRTGLR
jgi:hypothetical protein